MVCNRTDIGIPKMLSSMISMTACDCPDLRCDRNAKYDSCIWITFLLHVGVLRFCSTGQPTSANFPDISRPECPLSL